LGGVANSGKHVVFRGKGWFRWGGIRKSRVTVIISLKGTAGTCSENVNKGGVYRTGFKTKHLKKKLIIAAEVPRQGLHGKRGREPIQSGHSRGERRLIGGSNKCGEWKGGTQRVKEAFRIIAEE